MAVTSKIISSFNRLRDKARLNKFIREVEVLNEEEFRVDKVKAGTVLVEEENENKRWVYMGRCLTHLNHCGIYQPVDKLDIPSGPSTHDMSGKMPAMREVNHYSPREWLEHVYNTKDASELLKHVQQKDKMIFRS